MAAFLFQSGARPVSVNLDDGEECKNHSAKKPVASEAEVSNVGVILIHIYSLSRCVGYLFLYLFASPKGRIKNMVVVAKLAMTMALPLRLSLG